MTTIAYHHGDKVIATDGRICCGNEILNDQTVKMIRKGKKRFFLTGSLCDYDKFVNLCVNGAEYHGRLDVSAFMVDENKQVHLCTLEDRRFMVSKVEHRDAIGSGHQYAIAAMDFGLTASEAVKYATTKDCKTGGKIRRYQL